MLTGMLKRALTSFRKTSMFTAINLAGLAVCFAAVLLLGKYLVQETTYDAFHANSARLYRAWIHEDHGEGKTFTDITTPIVLAPTLTQNQPEIERVVRIDEVNLAVRNGEASVQETIHLVDADFFSTFSFKWLEGDQGSAFDDVNDIVLTPPLAQKYFGQESPLGKTLEMETNAGFETFEVVGVVEAPPKNSSLQFQALIPFSEKYYGDVATSWFDITVETYVLLKEGEDPVGLEGRINELMRRVLGPAYPANGHYELHLQPMTAIHLDTSIPEGLEPLGDPVAVYLVASGAVLLLIIAAINHGTIALGSIAGRTKEVAMRRTVGAGGISILQQFCLEAAALCLVGMLLGFALAELYLPVFNQLAGTSLTLEMDSALFVVMAAALLMFSLLTGSVPALAVSRFKPGQLLRNRVYFDSDKSVVIRGLIVFQFSLAIMMLVGSVAVTLQMQYVAEKDLGFDKENLLVVTVPGSVAESRQMAERFIEEAEGLPFVSGITYASAPPGAGVRRLGYTDDQQIFRQFDAYYVGPDFLSVMGMDLIEGRDFRNDTFDAAQALIVNEAFLRDYGWEQGTGNRLPGKGFPEHEIVGVVRDANFTSLTNAVKPTVFVRSLQEIGKGITDTLSFSSVSPELLIRMELSRLPEAVRELESVWERIGADSEFDYYVLDVALEAQYSEQTNFQDIVLSSTALAVFVASIGLVAMAVLVTTRRTKEIGVRKVMGGSVWSIVRLLTNDFSKLVLIANVFAWPVAYFAMDRWLQNFAYRIDLTPLIFIGSGAIALCIAWVTVGGTAAKAAAQKPVLALRYE